MAGTVSGGTFTAAPGEKNDVRYDAYAPPPVPTVVDNGAPLIVGPGCMEGTPVTCAFTNGVTLRLGDRADKGSASAYIVATVYGEQGDDVIQADAEEPQAYGGPGDDQIRVSGNQVLGHGERGNDTVEGPFQSGVTTSLWGDEGDDTVIQRTHTSRCWIYGGRGADRLLSLTCTQSGGPGDDVMTRFLDVIVGGVMNGDEGGDIMIGGRAADTFDGGPGGDFIQAAADGVADTVVCGTGNDIVRANAADSVAADCENVTRVEAPAP